MLLALDYALTNIVLQNLTVEKIGVAGHSWLLRLTIGFFFFYIKATISEVKVFIGM